MIINELPNGKTYDLYKFSFNLLHYLLGIEELHLMIPLTMLVVEL